MFICYMIMTQDFAIVKVLPSHYVLMSLPYYGFVINGTSYEIHKSTMRLLIGLCNIKNQSSSLSRRIPMPIAHIICCWCDYVM